MYEHFSNNVIFTFQIRTKLEPLKWPISDITSNTAISNHSQQSISSQNEVIHPTSKTTFCPTAKPLLAIPIPAVPRVFESYHSVPIANEILNPDVPEFVPMDLTEKTNGFIATDENNEAKNEEKNEIQFEKIKEEIYKLTNNTAMAPFSLNNNSSLKIDDTLPAINSSTLDSLPENRLNRESDMSSDNTWKEVRRRVKQPHKDRSEEKEKFENTRNTTREELNFQFDEELDSPPPTGRHNAFSEWLVVHNGLGV